MNRLRLRLRKRDRPFRTFRPAADPYDSFILLSPTGSECGSLRSSASVEEEEAAARSGLLADSDSEASVALSLAESEVPRSLADDPETPSNFRAGDARILYWIEGVSNGVPIPAVGYGPHEADQGSVASCETCDSFCGYCCHGADCKCGCRRRLSPWGLSDIAEEYEEEQGGVEEEEGKESEKVDTTLQEDPFRKAITDKKFTPGHCDVRDGPADQRVSQPPTNDVSVAVPISSLSLDNTSAKEIFRRLVFSERSSESTHGGLDDQTSTIETTPPQTPTHDVFAFNWDTTHHLFRPRTSAPAPGQFEDAIESSDDAPPPTTTASLRRKAASQQLRQQAQRDVGRGPRGERIVTW